MWEISIWFAVFLFAINGFMVYFADAVTDYDLISPFTNATFTPQAQPNINNTIGNLTTLSTATNATGGADIGIWDAASFAFNGGIYILQFIYGTITGGFFLALGMPVEFLTILYGTELLFAGITFLHIFTGRF